MEDNSPNDYSIGELVRLMNRLLAPDGCPWDRRQTHKSLRPYVLEEAYEVVGAIDEEDPRHLAEELGDLLLQVVFHSALAEREGHFDLEDVVRNLCEKLVRRHPHVFGEGSARSIEEVNRTWEELKQQEKEERGASLMDGVSRGLPAAMMAQNLQKRAGEVGFDWNEAESAWDKVEEEIGEFRQAWQEGKPVLMEAEWGDIVFSLINVARLLDFDAETALQGANRRFETRFREMERLAKQANTSLSELNLQEMEQLWRKAKNGLVNTSRNV